MNQMSSYQEELQNLHRRRVYYIILIGGLMIVVLGLLDSTVAPDFSRELLLYHVIAGVFSVFLLFANYRDSKQHYSMIIGIGGYLSVAFAVLVMIYLMGGATSPYFVGLIVSMTIYSTLAPLTMLQTLISGFSLVGCYVITILLAESFPPQHLMELFSNLFFMTCFVFIAATQSWTDTTARKNEYRLRRQEKETADQLSQHAAMLEQEVDRRSKEQTASEQRYRLFFNQIADDVAVITPEGRIIQSNDSFDKHYRDNTSNNEKTFFDVIPVNERKDITKNLADIVISGQPISALQLSLIRKDGGETQVEINGTLLKRETKIIGILLVLRDISTRKALEKRLLEALKIKKQTELATILALAKLSEYRDVTPGNHLERIREYCGVLAAELARLKNLKEIVTSTYIQDIYHASILHDIGKVAIPDELLNKSGPLTRQEQDTVRQHTRIGGDVIKEMEGENRGGGFLSIAKQIAYFHHERWDGKGYPYGLQDDETPLAARILTLADAYEELTTTADNKTIPYTHEEAIKSIVKKAGSQFDPMIVEAFISRADLFNSIHQKFS
jgi:PAS domain S-box-containing protein